MRSNLLQLIGAGTTLANLMLDAEGYGISNRLTFIIVRELLREGEIYKVVRKNEEVYLMICDIELDIGLDESIELY